MTKWGKGSSMTSAEETLARRLGIFMRGSPEADILFEAARNHSNRPLWATYGFCLRGQPQHGVGHCVHVPIARLIEGATVHAAIGAHFERQAFPIDDIEHIELWLLDIDLEQVQSPRQAT